MSDDRDEREEKPHCLLCGTTENLTDEHIIPAALGGEDSVANGSCKKCNAAASVDFEAEFNNGLKTICYLLGIGNREGRILSIAAATVIHGTKFNLLLRPGGNYRFQDKKEEHVLDTGKKVTHYYHFSEAQVKKTQERLTRRGEQLKIDQPTGIP